MTKHYHLRIALVCCLLAITTAVVVIGRVTAQSSALVVDNQPVGTPELLQASAVLQLPLLIGEGELAPDPEPPYAPQPSATADPGKPTASPPIVPPAPTATTPVPSVTTAPPAAPSATTASPVPPVAPSATTAPPSPTLEPVIYKVLVFSKTNGFRHESIPDGIAAIKRLGVEQGFAVDATEDSTQFSAANLAQYQAVVFLMTRGNVLNDAQEAAFKDYIEAGGSYVGVHSASYTETGWDWYGGLVGASFKSPSQVAPATVDVEDPAHPSTAHLPLRWERTDEWYNFQANPRGKVHVLLSVDERTYSGGGMGDDHPIAWCQDYNGGRSWYTAGGHTAESYTEPDFVQHLLGGIEWAMGRVPGNCDARD